MEKFSVFKKSATLLIFILAGLLAGCEEWWQDQVTDPVSQMNDLGMLITEEGGIFTAMQGDFILTVPAGAVEHPFRLTVRELMNKSVRVYGLKTLVLEPTVVFSKPVQVCLKSGSCLGNDIDICNIESAQFAIWKNEGEFLEAAPPLVCVTCVIDQAEKAVKGCIFQTGVLATLIEESN